MLKWLRKWAYFIFLIGAGCLYLTCVDQWQVYAGPWAQAKEWYHGMVVQTEGKATGGTGEVPGNGAGKDSQGAGDQPAEDGDSGAEGGGLAGGGGDAPDQAVPGDTGQDGDTGMGGDASGDAAQDGIPAGDGDAAPGEPVYMTVEDDYFADAVFIGDSRTVGMYEYGGLEEIATFYASTGLTVYKMFDAEIVSVPGTRKKITVEEALGQNTFAKIYLMIGINEMGTGTEEKFVEAYRKAVEHLRELQPDAVIYLQGIIKVSARRSNVGDHINNEGIVARNEGIAQIADNVNVFYLDVNPLVCDETGGMISSYTFDGVHLKAKYFEIWKEYLKSHAISLD